MLGIVAVLRVHPWLQLLSESGAATVAAAGTIVAYATASSPDAHGTQHLADAASYLGFFRQ